MTWEKTVMSDKKILKIYYKDHNWLIFSHVLYRAKTVAQSQAEISFKAGYQQCQDDAVIEKTRQPNWGSWLAPLLEAQAEISFKAGYEKRKSEEATVSLADMCMKHRKFGIQTVVEWMIEPCHEHSSGGVMAKRECPICLQIALKEWGIDGTN